MYIKLYTISSVIFSLIFLIHFSLKIILYNTIILIPTDFSYSFLTQIFTQNYTIYTIILLFSLIFLSIFHSKSYYIYYYITIFTSFFSLKNIKFVHSIYILSRILIPIFTPKNISFFTLALYISPKFLPSKKIFSVNFLSQKKIKKEQHSDFATSPPHHYYPSSKWLSFLDQTG